MMNLALIFAIPPLAKKVTFSGLESGFLGLNSILRINSVRVMGLKFKIAIIFVAWCNVFEMSTGSEPCIQRR